MMYKRTLWVCFIALFATLLVFAPVNAQAVNLVWRGDYFDNPYLSGEPVVSRTDENIVFSWGTGEPVEGVPADNFSVRWGTDVELTAGTYRISTWADDEVRVIVDFQDTPLIDTFDQALAGERIAAEFTIPADGIYHIQVDYRENLDNAYAEVFLESLSGVVTSPEVPVLPPADVTATVLAGRLNVRDAPSTQTGNIITQINRDEFYPVLGTNADSSWYLIDVAGTEGWVSGSWVTLSPEDAEIPVVGAEDTVVVPEATTEADSDDVVATPDVTPEPTAEATDEGGG